MLLLMITMMMNALTGELWDVFCEDLVENCWRYNGSALYLPTSYRSTSTWRSHRAPLWWSQPPPQSLPPTSQATIASHATHNEALKNQWLPIKTMIKILWEEAPSYATIQRCSVKFTGHYVTIANGSSICKLVQMWYSSLNIISKY